MTSSTGETPKTSSAETPNATAVTAAVTEGVSPRRERHTTPPKPATLSALIVTTVRTSSPDAMRQSTSSAAAKSTRATANATPTAVATSWATGCVAVERSAMMPTAPMMATAITAHRSGSIDVSAVPATMMNRAAIATIAPTTPATARTAPSPRHLGRPSSAAPADGGDRGDDRGEGRAIECAVAVHDHGRHQQGGPAARDDGGDRDRARCRRPDHRGRDEQRPRAGDDRGGFGEVGGLRGDRADAHRECAGREERGGGDAQGAQPTDGDEDRDQCGREGRDDDEPGAQRARRARRCSAGPRSRRRRATR